MKQIYNIMPIIAGICFGSAGTRIKLEYEQHLDYFILSASGNCPSRSMDRDLPSDVF